MVRNQRTKFVKFDNRKVQIRWRVRQRIEERELCLDLRLHARDKSRIALQVKRHNDGAAQQTSKETRNPFRTVLSPQQDKISFLDPARFQLARESKGSHRNPFVRPTRNSQPAPARECSFAAARNEITEVTGDSRTY